MFASRAAPSAVVVLLSDTGFSLWLAGAAVLTPRARASVKLARAMVRPQRAFGSTAPTGWFDFRLTPFESMSPVVWPNAITERFRARSS